MRSRSRRSRRLSFSGHRFRIVDALLKIFICRNRRCCLVCPRRKIFVMDAYRHAVRPDTASIPMAIGMFVE